jgi:hypothetical protein
MASKHPPAYEGINNDKYGGMTQLGQIIKDAWAFELLDESETCEGWQLHKIEQLWDQVHKVKHKAGPSVSFWPKEIQERHKRINEQAMKIAREKGWNPNADIADES